MNTTATDMRAASSQREVAITSADLPLHCPRKGERTWDAHPPSSWPSVTGIASIRCVRPVVTTRRSDAALASSALCR